MQRSGAGQADHGWHDFAVRITDAIAASPGRHRPPSGRRKDQAARTDCRKRLTSCLRRWLSPESWRAAVSTWPEVWPVSPAPRWTAEILEDTCCVPVAACWMLREISEVAAPCSSTAAATVAAISDSRSIVLEISLM